MVPGYELLPRFWTNIGTPTTTQTESLDTVYDLEQVVARALTTDARYR